MSLINLGTTTVIAPIVIVGAPGENLDAHGLAERLAKKFPDLELRPSTDTQSALPLMRGAGAIIGFGHHITEQMVAGAPGLQWIGALTAGVDAVLALNSLPKSTVVTSMTGIHGRQMSELAFLMMLSLAREYPRMIENQKAHRWQRWQQSLLNGKTIVILGVGAVARALAVRCQAFGMRVIGVSRTPREEPGFDQMMPRSALASAAASADFFMVLAPLSSETRHIVGQPILSAMKRTAYVVNLARGGVVDERALIAALRDRCIAGAALDVFEKEPPAPDDPIWDTPRLLITPHVGGFSENYLDQMVPIIEGNIACYAEGRWSDMVNRVIR